jgi:hypothetical protein
MQTTTALSAPSFESPADSLRALAGRWAQKHPLLASRLVKAAEIALAPGAVRVDGLGRWLVASSREGAYVVEVEGGRGVCSCDDWQRRGALTGIRCKHLLACALLVVVERRFAVKPAPAPRAPSVARSMGQLARAMRLRHAANRAALAEEVARVYTVAANDDLSPEEVAERWDDFESERGWGDEEEF